MTHQLLAPTQMAMADRLAIAAGMDGWALMQRAGIAVASELLRRHPAAAGFDVLCGSGNNGGDGYVAAAMLAASGCDVRLFASAAPRADSDAERACAACPIAPEPLAGFHPRAGRVVVDALFGAGLARALDGAAADAARACGAADVPVVAIDLPSGISGASGAALGVAFRAALTITFFRRKPGHLLEPGRTSCGELVVAEIGIPARVLDEIAPRFSANEPSLWQGLLPRPGRQMHKYSRGHVAVVSGPVGATGAARLSVAGAQRAGAGAVTLLSPPAALAENAAHLTAAMLKPLDGPKALAAFIDERKVRALVLGPGAGIGPATRDLALAALEAGGLHALVLDADGLTALAGEPDTLFAASTGLPAHLLLTPHDGEFARLFPDLSDDPSLSKLDRALAAAGRANAVVVLKGADTVIAAPDGRAAINVNGSPWLATAGSGDVLAGLIAGLAAPAMPAYEAACAAVWVHAAAARRIGAGLIAEDLPHEAAKVIGELSVLTS